ncbi:MAG: two-component system sensor protein [Microbacterium sp.]|jgi:signal transduction histidine kinase|uniref:sensor histidine kinase n=1 Tax=Microbacterium sp. TaxID=51671 RepID=UPI00262B7EEC|nr:GAF domain-containing protein [Microbacterium sp.]MDF2562206.1 two-component system sensor protein [Microbacterium sp.]
MQDRCRQTHISPGPQHDDRNDAPGTRAPRLLATRRQLRGLLDPSPETAGRLDADRTLTRIVRATADLIQARYGALIVIDATGAVERFIHVGIDRRSADAIVDAPEPGTLFRAVVDTGRTIRLNETGDDPRSAGFPPQHPAMEGFLGVPVRIHGEEVCGVLVLSNRRTGVFTLEDEELVESMAATAGITIHNAREAEEAGRRQRLNRALSDVNAALQTPQREDILDVITECVTHVAACDLATIVVHVDADHLRIDAARGPLAAAYEHGILPAATSVAAHAIAGGGVMSGRLTDETTHTSLAGDQDAAGPTVAVPLVAAGHAIGALCVTRAASSSDFSPNEIDAISDFVAQAGIATSLAWAREDRQHLDIIEERNRIARDLHDNVIQRLFATGMSLQAFAASDPAHAEELEQHVAEIDAAITDIRSGIFSLRTRRVKNKDRPVRRRALDVITELTSALPSAPTITFVGPVDPVVTGKLADDVIAVVREALANVAHHAHASNCAVTVAVSEKEVVVTVQDDGDGIAEALGDPGGTENLAERAALHGGTFTLDQRTDRGTTARWSVPRPACPEESAHPTGRRRSDDGGRPDLLPGSPSV